MANDIVTQPSIVMSEEGLSGDEKYKYYASVTKISSDTLKVEAQMTGQSLKSITLKTDASGRCTAVK